VPNEMVPKRYQNVNSNQGEQGVGQIPVNIFGRMKNCAVGWNSEIDLEQAEIERTAMPDERYDSDNRNDEHQQVEQAMYGTREAARECTHNCWQCRWRVSSAPPESRHDHHPQEQTQQRVYVDPKCLSLLWPRIMQET